MGLRRSDRNREGEEGEGGEGCAFSCWISSKLLTPKSFSFSVAYPSSGPLSFEPELKELSSSTSHSPHCNAPSTELEITRAPKGEPHLTAFVGDVKPASASYNRPVATLDTYHKPPCGYPAPSIVHHPSPSALDNAARSSSDAYHPTSSTAYGTIPAPSEVQLHSGYWSADAERTASPSEPYST